MAGVRETNEFAEAIGQLGCLATAIDVFKTQFEDLQKHVDFIYKAMDTEFSKLNPLQQQQEGTNALPSDITLQKTPQRNQIVASPAETTGKERSGSDNDKNTESSQQQARSEIHHLCLTMCSRGQRKYVVSHLSEIQSRREEAISALESAPKPAKLVLECVGRFFLQGVRAFTKDSPMVVSRQASVLVLELFLGVIGKSGIEIEIDRPLKQEAENNAIGWKKRLVSEGGVQNACEIDARGLLLFIACFGIPKGFKNDDIRDLIRFSNLKEIGHLLKGSRDLLSKIPEIVENMKKNGMLVEAVDVLYAFGIESKFSPRPILISFLRDSKEEWQRTTLDASIPQMKEANEKHLAALQSVIKCLEDKEIDPVKLLPGWQIRDKIVKLEKDIADLNKEIIGNKTMVKRKAAGELALSNKWNGQEPKHFRFTANESTLHGSSLMTSPHVFQSHYLRTANYADATAAHVYNTGPLPHDGLGPMIGGGNMVNSVGVEVRMPPRILTRPTGSFTGDRAETSFGKFGSMMHANGSPYGWHRARDTAYDDRGRGPSFTGQPATTGYDAMYRRSPSLERFTGLRDPSSISGGNQKSSSDLYSFADSVI